jgi:hypothetical protein
MMRTTIWVTSACSLRGVSVYVEHRRAESDGRDCLASQTPVPLKAVPSLRDLGENTRLHLRNELRDARAAALRDAEGSREVVIAIERVGATLLGQRGWGLGAYEQPLRNTVVDVAPHREVEFIELFRLVREGRNAAVHEGAFARHLAGHATELALLVEETLMAGLLRVRHFMVRSPVVAATWHSFEHARRVLLANSFSYLPIYLAARGHSDTSWWLISDRAVARTKASTDKIKELMVAEVGALVTQGVLTLIKAPLLEPEMTIASALDAMKDLPALVIEPARPEALLGIVTAFDLL